MTAVPSGDDPKSKWIPSGGESELNDLSNPSSDDSEVSLWGYNGGGGGAGACGGTGGMMIDTLWVNGWVVN